MFNALVDLRTIGEKRIEKFLRDHAGHWMFVGYNIGGPYVGCNNCCTATSPRDWPKPPQPRE